MRLQSKSRGPVAEVATGPSRAEPRWAARGNPGSTARVALPLSDGTTAEYYVSRLARDSDTWTPFRRLTAGEPRVIALALPRAGGNPIAFWIENTAGDGAAALYSSVAEGGDIWGLATSRYARSSFCSAVG